MASLFDCDTGHTSPLANAADRLGDDLHDTALAMRTLHGKAYRALMRSLPDDLTEFRAEQIARAFKDAFGRAAEALDAASHEVGSIESTVRVIVDEVNHYSSTKSIDLPTGL